LRYTTSFLFTFALARTAMAADPLPEGDQGIAANYPGDAGIDGDPAVVFADDFEGYASAAELPSRWDAAVFQVDQIALSTAPEDVFAGNQALQFTVPQQDAELSNATDKVVSPELDVLYLRFYSKFRGPYDIVGSSHNGAMISSKYFINGQATPGVPADGTNKFLANLENWRGEAEVASPGLLNLYVYHPEQRSEYGDHFYSDGTITPYDPDPPPDYFGPDFIPRENIIPSLDEWHCYEYMVQANTPDMRDGRIAFWFDGVLAGDFQNLRLRDIDSLKIDRFGLSFHIYSNPGAENRKWYDNVVAATSYIGPVYAGGGEETGMGPGSSSDGEDSSGGAGSDEGDTGTPTSGGSASGPGSTGDEGGATTQGSSVDPSADVSGDESGAPQGDDGGCGCVSSEPRGVGIMLIVLGLLVRPRRRR
jgi:hypothetical protein